MQSEINELKKRGKLPAFGAEGAEGYVGPRWWEDAGYSANEVVGALEAAAKVSQLHGLQASDLRSNEPAPRRRMIVGLPITWARGRWGKVRPTAGSSPAALRG